MSWYANNFRENHGIFLPIGVADLPPAADDMRALLQPQQRDADEVEAVQSAFAEDARKN